MTLKNTLPSLCSVCRPAETVSEGGTPATPDTLWRRYSEFELLRTYLLVTYPYIIIPPLPEKRVSDAYVAKCNWFFCMMNLSVISVRIGEWWWKHLQLYFELCSLGCGSLQAEFVWHKLSADNLDPDFVERRRVGLENFLLRVASHPVLSNDKIFFLFLTEVSIHAYST